MTRRTFPLVHLLALCAAIAGGAAAVHADDNAIIVQSTTSTQNSGLFKHLLPKFQRASGITAHVVAVGTGQAIKNARNCDGDVLLVHAKAAEEKFVADGFGLARRNVMYNDFVILGPADDPAKVAGLNDAAAALKQIAGVKALFASRGDDSGTHKKETALWKQAGVDIKAASGSWYRETGSGMGATLNIAVGMSAYILSDRATWISFGNKGGFKVLVEGDKALFNQYGVIQVNPARCANVKARAAEEFVNWLTGKAGQAAIGAYKVDGKQLFFPNSSAPSNAS